MEVTNQPTFKTLKPVAVNKGDFDRVEWAIQDYFKKEIYLPLMRELYPFTGKRVDNAYSDPSYSVLRAIQDGQISFYRGRFTGRFSARISKELKKMGAVWDQETRSFKIPSSKLNIDVRNAISVSGVKFEQVTKSIDKKLAHIQPAELSKKLNLGRFIESTIWRVDKDVKKTIKAISVQPDLTVDQMKEITSTYNINMQKYIQEWTEKEIIELRAKISENVFSGRRYEGIAEELMASYGVSENKAKFLARQETSLYVCALKKARYLDAGITKYRWKCSHDGHPIRHDHKILDNTIQRYDSPPVTNLKSGARNNPGEDFNCYCEDEPIVEF